MSLERMSDEQILAIANPIMAISWAHQPQSIMRGTSGISVTE